MLFALYRLSVPDVYLVVDWGRFVPTVGGASFVVALALVGSLPVLSFVLCALWLWANCFGFEVLPLLQSGECHRPF